MLPGYDQLIVLDRNLRANPVRKNHPRGNPGANFKSISHRCHPILVAFVGVLTRETINLPLACLQRRFCAGKPRTCAENLGVPRHVNPWKPVCFKIRAIQGSGLWAKCCQVMTSSVLSTVPFFEGLGCGVWGVWCGVWGVGFGTLGLGVGG